MGKKENNKIIFREKELVSLYKMLNKNIDLNNNIIVVPDNNVISLSSLDRKVFLKIRSIVEKLEGK